MLVGGKGLSLPNTATPAPVPDVDAPVVDRRHDELVAGAALRQRAEVSEIGPIHAASLMSQLRKSSSAASQPLQQLVNDARFVVPSRYPFRGRFHAGFSLAIECTRMLATRRSRFMLVSSQPGHVQRDPAGEGHEVVFISHSVETSSSKVLSFSSRQAFHVQRAARS
jgi:hypothetical protein